jgi:hypothetical protein
MIASLSFVIDEIEMMPQPAATADRAPAPPLPPGVREEDEFVDVDLGGQQHQPAAPLRRDAAQQQQPASACPARSFCVAVADVLFGCLLSCLFDPQ